MDEIIKKMNIINKRKQYTETFLMTDELKNVYENNDDDENKNDIHENEKKNHKENFVEGLKNKKKKKKEPMNSSAIPTNEEKSKEMNFNTIYQTIQNLKINQKIEQILNLPNAIPNYLYDTIYSIVLVISEDKKNAKNDTEIIQKIIYFFILFPVCVFIQYNWFYVLAYKDDNNIRVANDSTRINPTFENIPSVLKPFFNVFLSYTILPLSVFDNYILKDESYFVKFCQNVKWKIIIKLFILIFSFYLVYIVGFFSSLQNILLGKMTQVGILCGIIILFHYVVSIPGTVGDLFGFIPKNVIGGILIFFYLVFRLIVAVYSISISSVILLLYVFILSLFSLKIFNNDNIWRTMQSIETFVKNDLNHLETESNRCVDDGLFKKIFYIIVEFLYKNLYTFCFFILLTFYISYTFTNMNSTKLNMITNIFMTVMWMYVFILMWKNLTKK